MSYHPLKYYDHELYIKDTTQSSSPSTGALVVLGGIGVSGNLSIGGSLGINGIFTNISTTVSTSATTGALVLDGGLGINNTTDSVSITNGGAMTIAGGAAIAKKLFVGGNVLSRNALVVATDTGTSIGGTVVLGYPNAPGTTSSSTSYTWNVGVDSSNQFYIQNNNNSALSTRALAISETAGTVSLKSKQSSTLVAIQPNREDQLLEQTFTTSTDSVTTATNVTGLVFYTSRAFICNLVVFINATSPLSSMYELRGILLGNGTWDFSQDVYMGDSLTGLVFSLTSGGQVQFTKTSVSGHVSTTFKWHVKALYD